jgi:peptide/nickel transport system permease protein
MDFLLRRLFSALLVLLTVSSLVFLLIHAVPGDPVDVILGEQAASADRLAMRSALGLDKPLAIQFIDFMQGMLTFNPGLSLHSRLPIADILAGRIPATLQLAVAALLMAVAIGLPLGLMAGLHQHQWPDRLSMLLSISGLAIPNFLLGPLLVLLFAILLNLLPVSGYDSVLHLVLPALTLGLSMLAVLARMTRSTVLEVLGEDFIRTARAKGLSPGQVNLRHVLANTWLPLLTVIGSLAGALLGGAVVTEIVFDWPGLGSLLVDSIQKRDYPVVQACVLLISLFYVLVNTLTDLLYGLVDPRVRLA